MNKYRIVIAYQNRQYRIDVLKKKSFWLWSWWEKVLTKTGSLDTVDHYVEKWCKEFGVDIKEVEDLTRP